MVSVHFCGWPKGFEGLDALKHIEAMVCFGTAGPMVWCVFWIKPGVCSFLRLANRVLKDFEVQMQPTNKVFRRDP